MDLKIEYISVKELRLSEYNPRKATEKEIKDLKESIKRFGLVDPIIVNSAENRKNVVIGGHFRLKVAKELGYKVVPVVYVNIPDPEKEKELNLRLNKNLGEWDLDLLANFSENLLLDVGFESEELDKIFGLDLGEKDLGEKEDEVPEPRKETDIKYGDIFQLGQHRLMCGDATKKEDVERLMDGKKANAVLTDPPYGQNQPGVPNDKPEELRTLIEDAVKWLPVENAAIVAFQSPRTFPVLLDALRNNNIKFERMLWMCKDAQCTYPWRGWIMKSEAILVASKGYPHWNDVKPYVHDTYRLPEVSGELPVEIGWHGSVKPQAVIQDILKRISYENDIVFDGFGGSGSTLIACEQLNRRCYMMEIEPIYCQVIIDRWEQFTGQKAEKIN